MLLYEGLTVLAAARKAELLPKHIRAVIKFGERNILMFDISLNGHLKRHKI